MIPTRLLDLANWCDGALIQGVPSKEVNSVSTDSRKVENGQLFIALKGERFNAHKFLGDVSSASAILVSELPVETESYTGGIIRVKDTLKGLQDIALRHRLSFPEQFVVGVTGSNGKTSCKDFLSAALGAGGRVNKTQGNLNNHIGLPLTVLSGSLDDKFGVWEMGMNHPGEIEVLAEIARPDAAVITHIGTAHIEHMGSREAIALEKSSLPAAVPASGYCVMPASDDFFEFVKGRVACELLGVGFDSGVVRATNVQNGGEGCMQFAMESEFGAAQEVRIPVRGRHMVLNALLAAAVAMKQGIDAAAVAEALSSVELTGGRLQERSVSGIRFLDDSYNANPDSMSAALRTLNEEEVSGRRIAVLGFMGELGEHEESEHTRLGERVVEHGIDWLITVGERAAGINAAANELEINENFSDHSEAAAFLKEKLSGDDLVLVKGSRAAGMEQVIEKLR